jgi:hypothetical protein
MGLIPNKVVTVSCTQRFTYKIDLELKAQNIHQYRTRSTNHPFHAIIRNLIHTQHHHNNHTTTSHMSVGLSVWGPPSCEGLLCGYCISVVNLTFFL